MMLRDILKKVEDDKWFTDLIDTMSIDFHTFEESDGILYEEDRLDGWDWATGLTKICVLTADFVVKKGFAGYVYDMNLETDEPLESDEYTYKDWEANYCDIEYGVYLAACEYGVEKFFAEIEPLGNHTYAQERCDYVIANISEDNDDCPECLRKIVKEVSAMDDGDSVDDIEQGYDGDCEHFMSRNVISYFLNQYDYDDVIKLFEFFDEFDITDLHYYNVGFFWDKESKTYKLKLFDYSGFESLTNKALKIHNILVGV